MATSFFLMELEHGKYFVGASKDPLKTLEEHREGVAGMAWTQIHHPVRLKEIVAVARPRELDDYVRRCMLEWGVEHVRGGSWCDVRLRDKDRREISEGMREAVSEAVSGTVSEGVSGTVSEGVSGTVSGTVKEKRKKGCVIC